MRNLKRGAVAYITPPFLFAALFVNNQEKRYYQDVNVIAKHPHPSPLPKGEGVSCMKQKDKLKYKDFNKTSGVRAGFLAALGMTGYIAIFFLLLVASYCLSVTKSCAQDEVSGSSAEELETDLDYYQKYLKYKKYKKRKLYRQYKEYKEKYKFENREEKLIYKDYYYKYKLYKKQPSVYSQYAQHWDYYKKYRGYKHKYKKYKKYAKYKKYNKSKYAKYKKYNKSKYKNGYDRYHAYLNNPTTDLGEATLGGGTLGPEITVGLWYYSRDDLRESPFKIKANKNYNIKNGDGAIVAAVASGTATRVTYDSGGRLKIYSSISETLSNGTVYFEAADGDNTTMIFDAYRPSSSFDQYRGKMRLRYNDDSKKIWVINTLPLEHYVWGMGEITGTGDMDYNRVMTVSFRTYGYWKIKFSTKYATDGFKVNATPGNQLYYGYDWETGHARIKNAAVDTQGKIVMSGGRVAITPYSSWTDGNTRSFEDRWGSDNYPWCQSVSDPYGKHSSMSTSELVAAGNHMVGLSAHGALDLAGDHNWNWDRILRYYYTGIDILKVY